MSAPERLRRFPSAAAAASLAKRFSLPNSPEMQDWPWEVSDPDRIDEFLAAYREARLDEDERYALMELLLQSFEDSESELAADQRWQTVLSILDRNVDLHASTLWYWADPENEAPDDQWRVTPDLRRLLARHRHRLER